MAASGSEWQRVADPPGCSQCLAQLPPSPPPTTITVQDPPLAARLALFLQRGDGRTWSPPAVELGPPAACTADAPKAEAAPGSPIAMERPELVGQPAVGLSQLGREAAAPAAPMRVCELVELDPGQISCAERDALRATFARHSERPLLIAAVLKEGARRRAPSRRVVGVGAFRLLLSTPRARGLGGRRPPAFKACYWHDLERCSCPADAGGLRLTLFFVVRPHLVGEAQGEAAAAPSTLPPLFAEQLGSGTGAAPEEPYTLSLRALSETSLGVLIYHCCRASAAIWSCCAPSARGGLKQHGAAGGGGAAGEGCGGAASGRGGWSGRWGATAASHQQQIERAATDAEGAAAEGAAEEESIAWASAVAAATAALGQSASRGSAEGREGVAEDDAGFPGHEREEGDDGLIATGGKQVASRLSSRLSTRVGRSWRAITCDHGLPVACRPARPPEPAVQTSPAA